MESSKDSEDLLVFEDKPATKVPDSAPGELMLAHIVGFDADGNPLVSFDQNESEPSHAMSTISLHPGHLGRQVATMFIAGTDKLVIIGLMKSSLDTVLESTIESQEAEENLSISDVEQAASVDGKRVLIEGKEEIVLKCGDSSITLTKSGKILIRGKYLLNRSSGVNRIMGGSVQVN